MTGLRAAATDAYRQSVAAGAPLSAAEIAERYDRSPRWGRQVIADAVAADHRNGHRHPGAATPAPVAATTSAAVRRVTTLSVLAVAVVAAAASYDHQRVLAEVAGEGWRAWLLPISVDGLVVAASMSMLVRRRTGHPAGVLAWVSLLAGVAASLAANVAAAEPTVVGRLVAAWPPVALLLAYELLMQQVRADPGHTARVQPTRREGTSP